ncbi:MAG: hypothetical protein KIT68_09575 [Phycisphaeraceae bacterium]|nr:hypothetical protein [Phycisphaeraceae bacterium]
MREQRVGQMWRWAGIGVATLCAAVPFAFGGSTWLCTCTSALQCPDAYVNCGLNEKCCCCRWKLGPWSCDCHDAAFCSNSGSSWQCVP